MKKVLPVLALVGLLIVSLPCFAQEDFDKAFDEVDKAFDRTTEKQEESWDKISAELEAQWQDQVK
ncbi:MAG: hypothetical protein HZA78_03835 [Candidatus Schekmanbacteria bacterium]|nr:hypothetical protein [Candidatus Schekmanbacteria bacterium]